MLKTNEQSSNSGKRELEQNQNNSLESPTNFKKMSNRDQTEERLNLPQTNRRNQQSQICLNVPFWKQLNSKRGSIQFHTRHIDCFSLISGNDGSECFEDTRYQRVYKYPLTNLNVNFDLKVGENEFVSQNQGKTINPMLWWLLRHKNQMFHNDQFHFDILSWRGVLRLIMFSIYEKQTDWLLAVVKFKNAYFLCEYGTDLQLQQEENMTPTHRSFCYYGHKFEEYVTKNMTNSDIWNSSQQISGVFQSNIGPHRLLYGAEIDCIVNDGSSQTEHIELKVCAGKSLDDLPFQHNRKFAKWWLQSFLAGIRTLVIGLRDDNGIVNQLCPMNVANIERAGRTWTRESFFNFFDLFVNFLKVNVQHDYSLQQKDVVLFRFLPSAQQITMEQSSDAKYHFIPDWFFNEFSHE